jgi:hypothetical protein
MTSPMDAVRRRFALIAVAGAAVIAGVVAIPFLASASPAPKGGDVPGSGSLAWKTIPGPAHGEAFADARKRLGTFKPPPGSHRVAGLPKSLHLRGPFETIGSPRFLDLHRLWVSSEPVAHVRAYLKKAAPPGSKNSVSSELGGPAGTIRWDQGYGWPELPGVADNRELLAGVVARPGGGSAIRADAQATWIEPKPKSERVPASAAFLEVTEELGGKKRRVGVPLRGKVEATAMLLDRQPIVQLNGAEECGFIPSERVTLKAIFRAAPGSPVLTETEEQLPAGFCDDIGMTIEGKEYRGLYDEREAFVERLQSLLGAKYAKPLTDQVEEF